MSKSKQENKSKESVDLFDISCPNCGTNDTENVGGWNYLGMSIFAINASLAFLVLGGRGLAAIGFISLFLFIPVAIIFLLKALGGLLQSKKYKCNNCGNRFQPPEDVATQDSHTYILLTLMMIGILIYLLSRFAAGP